jgi:hypothetical protein
LQSRRVDVTGSTPYSDEAFVVQAMRGLANAVDGILAEGCVLSATAIATGAVAYWIP